MRSEAIEALFPRDAVVETADSEAWDAPLAPSESVFVARAVPRRRREFAAGRHCARRALARIGAPLAALEVGRHRMPAWPPGIVGSITHTDGFCAAVVARDRDLRGIGIDAERALPLPDGLVSRICTASEIRRASADADLDGRPWCRLLFSAKESVFKCVFPEDGRWLEFADVEVELDARDGRFVARLADGMRCIDGRFAWDSRHLITSAWALRADAGRIHPGR